MNRIDVNAHTPGEIIKKHRRAKRMTQAELAKILGVSKSTIGKWETNVVTTIKQDMRSKLVKVLGINNYTLTGISNRDEYVLKIITSLSDFTEEEFEDLYKHIEKIKDNRSCYK